VFGCFCAMILLDFSAFICFFNGWLFFWLWWKSLTILCNVMFLLWRIYAFTYCFKDAFRIACVCFCRCFFHVNFNLVNTGILIHIAQFMADFAPYHCTVAVSSCKDNRGYTNSSCSTVSVFVHCSVLPFDCVLIISLSCIVWRTVEGFTFFFFS